MSLCNTKYACWQDSDDISNLYRIKLMLDAIQITDSPIIYSYACRLNKYIDISEIPSKIKSKRRAVFASAMFEISKIPKFEEINRKPTPTTLGGEDARWRNVIRKKYGRDIAVPLILYYINRHSNRISHWRKHPNSNIEWYNRMVDRINN